MLQADGHKRRLVDGFGTGDRVDVNGDSDGDDNDNDSEIEPAAVRLKLGRRKARQIGSLTMSVTPSLNEFLPMASVRVRAFHTGNTFAAVFAMGLVSSITATTFGDFAFIFNCSVVTVTRFLLTRSAGILVGSLVIGGVLFRWINARWLMVAFMIAGGFGTAVAPIVPRLWIAHVGMFFTGASSGVFECGVNMWLVYLWGKDIGPVLQLYNLMYGLGALAAPPLTAPFISHPLNNSDVSAFATSTNSNVVDATSTLVSNPDRPSSIWIPYTIAGGVYAFTGVLLLVGLFIDDTDLRQIAGYKEHDNETTADEIATQSDQPSGSAAISHSHSSNSRSGSARAVVSGPSATEKRFERLLVAELVGYIAVAVCIEQTMAQMVFLYAEHSPNLRMSPTAASNLVTTFWATYTGGRLIASIVSFFADSRQILVGSQLLATAGCALLLLLIVAPANSLWALWLSTVLVGAGVAPLYGSSCALTFQYFRLNFVYMSLVITAACVGQALPTYIVAPWVQTSIDTLPLVMLGQAALLLLITVPLLVTIRGRASLYEREHVVDDRNVTSLANLSHDQVTTT